jgi:two-component system, OmpR family, copper resistance phosphate regulon response regulator CusR
MMTVAVIEHEPAAAAAIARTLSADGLVVRMARDGEYGLKLGRAPDVDLVVLDLTLPDCAGMRVLSELSTQRPGLPVIVLGARDTLAARIDALHGGAVDHIAKPFALAELGARVHAQLRTSQLWLQQPLEVGPLRFDVAARRVCHPGGEIHLSNREFDLLAFLARNRGEVLDRRQIQRAVWGYLHDPGTNVVDVYIGYVRRKLATPAGPLLLITTVRSRGYRLEEPPRRLTAERPAQHRDGVRADAA